MRDKVNLYCTFYDTSWGRAVQTLDQVRAICFNQNQVRQSLYVYMFICKNCGKIVVEPQIGVNFGRKIVLWLGWGIHSKANWVGVGLG